MTLEEHENFLKTTGLKMNIKEAEGFLIFLNAFRSPIRLPFELLQEKKTNRED